MRNFVSYFLNYPRTVYLLYEKRNKPVPYHLSAFLRKVCRNNTSSLLVLPTYDGSSQACHPSYAVFQGKEFLAYTPYPYGMERYENPCLAMRESFHEEFSAIQAVFPIVRPKSAGKEHYSDPCCVASEQELFLVYRKCVRFCQRKKDILYESISADGVTWSEPVQIAEGEGDTLISPAIAGETLFCVEFKQKETKVVEYQLNLSDKYIKNRRHCSVIGIDPQWQVWHIDVRKSKVSGRYDGLFLLRDRETTLHSRLALLSYTDHVWTMVQELSLNPAENGYINYLYKSCFFTDGKILCSARDKRDRWVILEREIPNG